MSNKKLTILALIAVLVIIWAVVHSRIASRPAKPARQAITYLIQGLNPDAVGAIVVGTGPDVVRLKRTANIFVVANKDDYPAQTNRINDLITNILDIKTTELITSNPDNHPDLEVTEEKARTVVKFLNGQGGLITGLAIGKQAESGDSYVRQLLSDDVYLAGNTPWVRGSAIDYIDRQILQIKSDDILSVTVTDPNGSYTLTSEPNSTDITLENLPEGKQLKKDDCKKVFSALSTLQFNDVMKPSSAPDDLKFDRSYTCRLQDSTVYTLQFAKSNGKDFIKCRAEFTDAAKKFNKDHGNWIYEIADWKAKNLTMTLDSLLQDIEKPEQTEDANTPAERN